MSVRFTTDYPVGDPSMNRQLAEAVRYRAYVEDAAKRYKFQPSVITGIGSRESQWGLSLNPPGPEGTGDFVKRPFPARNRDEPLPPDGGFGRGLLQIDYDYHEFARIGNWRDPKENIFCGAKILYELRRFFERKTNLLGLDLLRATIASYNTGPRRVLIAIRKRNKLSVNQINRRSLQVLSNKQVPFCFDM